MLFHKVKIFHQIVVLFVIYCNTIFGMGVLTEGGSDKVQVIILQPPITNWLTVGLPIGSIRLDSAKK